MEYYTWQKGKKEQKEQEEEDDDEENEGKKIMYKRYQEQCDCWVSENK